MDRLDQVLIKVRESAPESISEAISDLTKKLDTHIETHEKNNKEINEKLDPVYEAFRNVTGFKSTILVIATLIGGIWAAIEGWKKLVGK